MSIGLRDLKLAKAALRAKCKIHAPQPAATCETCHMLALAQQDKQWKRQREAAHIEYLERINA